MKEILCLLPLLLPAILGGTTQIPDVIYIGGDKKFLRETPLNVYLDRTLQFPDFDQVFPGGNVNTACWRGHTVTWKVQEDVLYLQRIQDCQRQRSLRLNELFPESDGSPVNADWFSGYLTLPEGPLSAFEHIAHGRWYERETLLQVDSGIVKETIHRSLGPSFVAFWILRYPEIDLTIRSLEIRNRRLEEAFQMIFDEIRASDLVPKEVGALLRSTSVEFIFRDDTGERMVSFEKDDVFVYDALVGMAQTVDARIRLLHDDGRVIVEARDANKSP